MLNAYVNELNELKSSFRKALIFCITFNVLPLLSIFNEISLDEGAGSVSITDLMILLLESVIVFYMWGWWGSCLGFAIVNYRYTRNPSASIIECLKATVSGKKYGLAYTARGPLNALDVLNHIKDLESMIEAEKAGSMATASTRLADF